MLCAGAVNTPQLLMLSGVGDRDHLAKHGIDVEHHAPEVGQNLLDHLGTPLGFEVREDSLFAAKRPRELANYLLRRRGMLTSNIAEAYGFVRSSDRSQDLSMRNRWVPASFAATVAQHYGFAGNAGRKEYAIGARSTYPGYTDSMKV